MWLFKCVQTKNALKTEQKKPNFNVTVRLCGSQIPLDPIISSGSRLLLTYKTSEHSPKHTGFIAAYEGKLFTKPLFSGQFTEKYGLSCFNKLVSWIVNSSSVALYLSSAKLLWNKNNAIFVLYSRNQSVEYRIKHTGSLITKRN